MRYHYDMYGKEAVLRDIPVYAASALAIGTVMSSGPVATAVNPGRAIRPVATVLNNIIGVLNEDVSAANALAVAATGFETYAKIIINPGAVYLAEYDTTGTTILLSAADATGKSITSLDTGVADQEGGWAYVLTGTGLGNLFCIGASVAATGLTAVTDYDDNLEANAIADTAIVLKARYSSTATGGDVDLNTACTKVIPYAGTGAATVLENYIESRVRPLEPLVISRHSGINYASEAAMGLKFHADLYFTEHLLGSGGTVCTRPIV